MVSLQRAFWCLHLPRNNAERRPLPCQMPAYLRCGNLQLVLQLCAVRGPLFARLLRIHSLHSKQQQGVQPLSTQQQLVLQRRHFKQVLCMCQRHLCRSTLYHLFRYNLLPLPARILLHQRRQNNLRSSLPGTLRNLASPVLQHHRQNMLHQPELRRGLLQNCVLLSCITQKV